MRMIPVTAKITGYVTYPGPSGPIDSSLPGPCGTHRYFATLNVPGRDPEPNYIVIGSVSQCWQPPTLYVVPLPAAPNGGNGISGTMFQNGNDERIEWHYRELPLVAPCNPGGG